MPLDIPRQLLAVCLLPFIIAADAPSLAAAMARMPVPLPKSRTVEPEIPATFVSSSIQAMVVSCSPEPKAPFLPRITGMPVAAVSPSGMMVNGPMENTRNMRPHTSVIFLFEQNHSDVNRPHIWFVFLSIFQAGSRQNYDP